MRSHRLVVLALAVAVVPAVAAAAESAGEGPRPSAPQTDPQPPREGASSSERRPSPRLPYAEEFTCIAEHESGGRWDISTGNGYYGGLQMDHQFQRTYAPALYRRKGTADNWTRTEQIRTAAKAVKSRGFSPWPTTARTCGLV